jgi:hypothetical protein
MNPFSSRINKFRCIWIAFSVMLWSCGGSMSTAAVDPAQASACVTSKVAPIAEVSGTRTLLQVKPSDTSSCISKNNAPHQAYRDSGAVSKAVLAVFLPGTGGTPAQFPAFLQHGATRGYHVIGLTYTNDKSVTVLCNEARANADCAGEVRQETLTGRDTSSLITVSDADSIEGRLIALLKYLDFHRAGEGWGQFLTSTCSVAWEKVIVSGNSQGSGYAAYIAKVRQVNRVGIYAGPSDWVNASNSPVNWYSLPSLTSASAYFGFVHSPDSLANSSGNPTQVTDVWKNFLGMGGNVTNVRNSAPPFGNSQRLITTACTGFGTENEHNCPMMRGNESVWNIVSYP